MKEFYIGTSGWFYYHWKEKFYPKELQTNEWLNFYCKHFNSVEVNSSFYRLPFENMLKGWLKRSPNDFKFTLKGWRRITHLKRLQKTQEDLDIFFQRISILKDKICCILWQLPPSLKIDLKLLEGFLNKLPTSFIHTLEFRHDSWYNEKTFKTLKRYNIAFCTVSSPKFPIDFTLTANFAYIRFHGEDAWYQHNYPKKRLLWFANKIKKLNASKIFIYFNNDNNAYAVFNAKTLMDLLK